MAVRLRPWHVIAAAPLLAIPWLVLRFEVAVLRYDPVPWSLEIGSRQQLPFPRPVPGRMPTPRSGRPALSCWNYDEVLEIQQQPRRIVAASVLSAEVLLAIAPRERVAGVHYLAAQERFSLVAVEAATLPLVGADPEQLLAVRPDLVLIDEFTRVETRVLLQRAQVPVVRTHGFVDFDDVADNVRLIGWATGCDEAAERLVAELQRRLALLAEHADAVRGWRVLNLDGGLGTYGADTLVDAIVRAAGATNLAAEHGVGAYRALDIESVLAWRPDALLLGYADSEAAARHWLQQVPGLALLPCVQKNRIVVLANAVLGSTSHHAVESAMVLQTRLLGWGRP